MMYLVKLALSFLAIALSAVTTCGQQGDSLSISLPRNSNLRHHGRNLGRLRPVATDSVVVIDNGGKLTLHPGAGSNLPGTALSFSGFGSYESEVSSAELTERDALVRRDTAALRRLWQMDYTAGNTQSRKLTNRGLPIPYYASFNRIVERVSMHDGVAYANGIDVVVTSDKPGGATISTSHKFIHAWKLFGTQWKMISRFPNDY